MVTEKRSQVVTLRMAPAEFEMLQQLADADGVYQSDVIRLLVRRAHTERFGSSPKPKPKRK